MSSVALTNNIIEQDHRFIKNRDDMPAVEISLKLEGEQLAGRAFYVVDPGAGEVFK